MPITNWFDSEKLIVDAVSDLFPENMVFVLQSLKDFDNNKFKDIDIDSDKVALLIIYEDHYAGEQAGSRTQIRQKITTRYRIGIAAPRQLYKDNIGRIMPDVIKRLNGQRLSPSVVIKELSQGKQDQGLEFDNNTALLTIIIEAGFLI